MLRYPYLPQVRWQFNNPRRGVRQVAGSVPEVTDYAYEYNAEGLPVEKRTTKAGKVTTMRYQY